MTITIEEYKSQLDTLDEKYRLDVEEFTEKLESASIEIKELETKVEDINNKNLETTKRLRKRIADLSNR